VEDAAGYRTVYMFDAAGQIRGLAIILAAFAEGLGVLAIVVGLLTIFIK
jgi:F0F1-type ATP synthase membrane subunit c/vacuolar-type H+-ATPase subunit K